MVVGKALVAAPTGQRPVALARRSGIRMICRLLCLFGCLSVMTIPASAQEATPQQVEPDRPDVTNGTHIVDIGVLQVEFGGIYTRDDGSQHSIGTPVTARVGLTEWLEARVGTDGVLVQTDG